MRIKLTHLDCSPSTNDSTAILSSQQLDLDKRGVYTLEYEKSLNYIQRAKYFVMVSTVSALGVHSPVLDAGWNISRKGFLIHLNMNSNKEYNNRIMNPGSIVLNVTDRVVITGDKG